MRWVGHQGVLCGGGGGGGGGGRQRTAPAVQHGSNPARSHTHAPPRHPATCTRARSAPTRTDDASHGEDAADDRADGGEEVVKGLWALGDNNLDGRHRVGELCRGVVVCAGVGSAWGKGCGCGVYGCRVWLHCACVCWGGWASQAGQLRRRLHPRADAPSATHPTPTTHARTRAPLPAHPCRTSGSALCTRTRRTLRLGGCAARCWSAPPVHSAQRWPPACQTQTPGP